jgi:hypothetical protein
VLTHASKTAVINITARRRLYFLFLSEGTLLSLVIAIAPHHDRGDVK